MPVGRWEGKKSLCSPDTHAKLSEAHSSFHFQAISVSLSGQILLMEMFGGEIEFLQIFSKSPLTSIYSTMVLPQIYRTFQHSKGNTPTILVSVTEELSSSLKSNEVLIRIHVLSLNYRLVAIMPGTYPVKVIERCVPASDCATEVFKIESEIHDLRFGDRVVPIFDLNNIDGTEEEKVVFGGDINGELR
jgi:hypothetical protein